MTRHICLYGGPGVGKSTTSAGLFHYMKTNDYKVELVTEYAKDLVYSKDFMTLSDQIMVFAHQHHKWFKLEDQVDYTISDAPFLLSSIYVQDKPHLNKQEFIKLIVDTYKRYDTINILLERNVNRYQEYGRNETLEESIAIDQRIKDLLEYNGIPYIVVPFDTAVTDIIEYLKTENII